MRVVRNLSDIEIEGGSAVTVGSFDGVHRGHQAIFENLIAAASKKNLQSVIVTFDPHPRKVLSPDSQNLRLLTSLDEKIEIFQRVGVDTVLVIHFSREFSKLSYVEFVEDILVNKLKVREMVIGHDHHFGRNREGGLRNLIDLGEKHGFGVGQVAPLRANEQIISSSLIREYLEDGEVEQANAFLGRSYGIKGRVIKGDGRGKEIGYPTANIQPHDPDKVIPRRGVYAVEVDYGNDRFKGMMNIGYRPTFNFDPLTLEVHIFNFGVQIYGEVLSIYFKKFIRQEKKFNSVQQLKAQLDQDKKNCENI